MILWWLIHYAMVCSNASQSQTLTSLVSLPHLIKQIVSSLRATQMLSLELIYTRTTKTNNLILWYGERVNDSVSFSFLPSSGSPPLLIHLLLKISTTHPATPLGQSNHEPHDAPCWGKRILPAPHTHNALPPVRPWLIQGSLKRLLGY